MRTDDTWIPEQGLFDAHFHIIDPSFPLTENAGYLPPPFTVDQYLERTCALGITGGAVVSGSFQGFDQSYLRAALKALGDGFFGVAQVPSRITDEEITSLNDAGVRAIRFNLYRGGSEGLSELDRMARRVYDVAGWHTEMYVDAADLNNLVDDLVSLPSLSIDHLGMTENGLATLLRMVEKGVHVKVDGFGRGELNVPHAVSALFSANPNMLMFGTDLPSTRARVPFSDNDIDVIVDAVGENGARLVLGDNARALYVGIPTGYSMLVGKQGDTMPCVAEFLGIMIYMYVGGHPPPHFHAHYGEYRADYSIADGCLLHGKLPNSQDKRVRKWAREHVDALAHNWELCESGNLPERIG